MFKEKNDVKNTSIFILVFYNNIHCSFVTLLSFYFNTEKDSMVVIHLSIYVWSTRDKVKYTLRYVLYLYPPPPRFTNSMLFWSIETIPFLWNVKRSDSLKFDHHIYCICTFICFLFLIERLIIFTFTETIR